MKDHTGTLFHVKDHSVSSAELSAVIRELEVIVRNLQTRLRYRSTRFNMTTRSQNRFAKCIAGGVSENDLQFLLTHQKELQDGEDLLASLREEAKHMKMLEGKDHQFEKSDIRFKARANRAASV